MKTYTGRGLLAALLIAVMMTGCHKPTFDHLESKETKWSLAVIAAAGDEAENNALQAAVNKTAQEKSVTAQVRFVKPEEAAAALEQTAQMQGLDLVVLGTPVDNLADVAAKHPQLRFAVAGEGATEGTNVRRVALERKQLLFLAGFLAAEANKQSSEPITVLVDKVRPATDPDWQMILAGVIYGGRKDAPVQVPASAFAPQQESSRTGTQPRTPQPKLSGRGLIFLDSTERTAPESAFAAMRSKGMVLIRTDQDSRPITLQERVAALPATVLDSMIGEEAGVLTSGRWAGDQTAALKQKNQYDLRLPELFADRGLATRLEQIEELLAAGRVQPESFLSARRD
ncbi:hypothetical protein OS242_01260 [Tumebacillus sp. DT12]|uniref:ABC transporter substrate-binding protein PnrA-like domain-containing protein n=1 Tax=Tumebacillus lacus TaxID=2995335 RepID=A0ABT3WZ48_9BACL|nr:hypothetical protein [Tumebacillus lacus]MCX7568596.1 hypothetical protein [Tumebacillus lacus]